MTDRDPCQGCRHLEQRPWPQRPDCARGAQYGDRACRPERAAPKANWPRRDPGDRHA